MHSTDVTHGDLPLTPFAGLRDRPQGLPLPLPVEHGHHRGANAEGWYRSLFENNLDAVFSLDRNGQFMEANAAAERLLGYSPYELRSMTFADVCALEDRHKSMFFFARAMSGTPRSVELAAICKDGCVLDLLLTGAPITTDGGVVGLFCIARDVTRKRKAEAELRQARRESEQAKDRFLAVISHELRTPLMPVLTSIQMLERSPDLPHDFQETLGMMRRNLELEARLIDDLLDLNRIRKGKLTLAFQEVDVHSKLRHVVDLCTPEITDKNLTLELDLAAQNSLLAADSSRLQQILWHVIGNAVKFTPADGSITIRTCNGMHTPGECHARCGGDASACPRCQQENFLAIQISDTGVGITSETMDRLFQAFERGEREDSHSGRGVGLAVSRALVELHGGHLMAHSGGRGHGSTFTILLPRRGGRAAAPEPEKPHKPGRSGDGRRVLLVEDHVDTARVMARLLREMGYQTTVAGTVEAAKAQIRQGGFSLLISDIGLPDGTGLDVMRYARTAGDMPAIALSGYGMEEDIRRSHEAGFAEHLVKPINLPQLQQTIDQLLAST